MGEDYILRLLDLCAELDVKIVPMFWGVAFGWELPPVIPGAFGGRRLQSHQGGTKSIREETSKIRQHAKSLGIYLCHEIHPGTAAMCADDFNMLVEICDGDRSLAVNADPSHCWEGEDWETRLQRSLPGFTLPREEFRDPSRRAVAQNGAGLAKTRDAICGHSLGRSQYDAIRRASDSHRLSATLLPDYGSQNRSAGG